jgi:hypothetical protein
MCLIIGSSLSQRASQHSKLSIAERSLAAVQYCGIHFFQRQTLDRINLAAAPYPEAVSIWTEGFANYENFIFSI